MIVLPFDVFFFRAELFLYRNTCSISECCSVSNVALKAFQTHEKDYDDIVKHHTSEKIAFAEYVQARL